MKSDHDQPTHDDESDAGALLFRSLTHVPDGSVGVVLAEVFRVLRPVGIATIGFHVGDRVNRKTTGHGGLPMATQRPPAASLDGGQRPANSRLLGRGYVGARP